MPITVDWLDKSASIILLRYAGTWDWSNNTEIELLLRQLSYEAAGRFDIIVDLADNYTLPVGALDIWLTSVEERERDFPNWGISVYVSNSPVMQAYFEAGHESSASVGRHCRLAESISAALRLIIDDRMQTQASS